MKSQCDKCQGYYDRGSQFCGACGYRFPKKKGQRNFLEKIMLLIAFITAIYLICEIAVLLIKAPAILSIIGDFGVSISIIIPKSIRLITIHGLGAEIYWILIVITISVCTFYALRTFLKGIKKLSKEKDDTQLTKTAIYWVGILFCADIFVQIVYFAIAIYLGLKIDSSWMDEYTHEQLLYMLANASVWEEIISRVMMIGIPIMAIQLFRTKKLDSMKCLLGGFGMNKIALILILFSGIIFGLAHYYSWGMTKAIITCVGGIVLGYVYVQFGLYASIIMHFLTDYLGSFMYVGVPSISVLGEITFIALGLFACAYIATRIPKKDEAITEWNSLTLLPKIKD
ncbi:MAG: CPBP family intramembrane metalloprotease [Candidatus Methanogranum gryphiswaldense]|nr:MAG: CPBP family intramembrane metalloprotease [Candidatus Methanogranum sp. U3.2.1]